MKTVYVIGTCDTSNMSWSCEIPHAGGQACR